MSFHYRFFHSFFKTKFMFDEIFLSRLSRKSINHWEKRENDFFISRRSNVQADKKRIIRLLEQQEKNVSFGLIVSFTSIFDYSACS